MRIALDTNRYVDLAAGSSDAVRVLEHAEEIALPFVVVAELRAGFAIGTKGAENERVLQRFLRKPHVRVLYASDTTTRTYATLYRQLRQAGTPIPTNDLRIAALVVEHGLVLYSRDAHFRRLPQLEIL
jgi:tRNA(fMet)-specific endonuclease VapC